MVQDYNTVIIPDDWKQDESIIKVIGVGGGGCNAVNYMYTQCIEGCDFVVCNTNAASLDACAVPVKIRLGQTGLGAGTNPAAGRNAALESQDEIAARVLDNGTRMVFVTAGLGGGTGTGAAPVIAKMAKDRGILTVAVVTLPFKKEGYDSMKKAVVGVHELEHNTDALLVINNEKLYQHYGDKLIYEAFPKTDEVLATAVKGIIEVISRSGYIDIDFQDVTNILKDSGVVLMGYGEGSGPDRIEQAVKETFGSPLLADYDMGSARSILLNITSGKNKQGLKMSDLELIDEMVAQYTPNAAQFKKGIVWDDDPEFGDKVRITVIVTGFKLNLEPWEQKANQENRVIIDKDFEWDFPAESGKDLPDPPAYVIRGWNPGGTNEVGFSFDHKPDLCVGQGEPRADLEKVPSIRRKKK